MARRRQVWCLTKQWFTWALLFFQISCCSTALAEDSDGLWQQALNDAIRSHPSMAGVVFRAKFIKSGVNKPVCSDPSLAFPPKLIGTISIQLKCPSIRWANQAQVLVETKRNYVALSKSLPAGAVIEGSDLVLVDSDWGVLPEQTIDTLDQATGKTLIRSLAAGVPITLNLLRQTSVIKSGERVRVLLIGKNFSVGGEGVALGNAGAGDQVKVKMGGGQVISGVVVRAGLVQVTVE